MSLLSWQTITAWRLTQHNLHQPADSAEMLNIVSNICGLQAQVMSAAELALSARVSNISPDNVQNALWQKRSLVKSWFMRGTLHILTANDLSIYVAALSTLRHFERASWQKYFGITLDELHMIFDALPTILSDEGLTREALTDAIVEKTGHDHLRETLLSGWGAILKPPSFKGLLCYGPNQGKNVTFVYPQKWLSRWDDVDSDVALQEIARRFLNAYGPATTDEFSRYLGITKSQAKKVFKSIQSEIAEVAVEEWVAFAPQKMLNFNEDITGSIRLLPYFDPYTIAVAKHATEYILSEEHLGRVYRPQGWISPVVLVDGRMVGVWKHDTSASTVEITIEPFESLSNHVKNGIEAEAHRIGKFLDLEYVLTYA